MTELLECYRKMIREIKNPNDAMFVCGYIWASIDMYVEGETKDETV